MQADFQPGDVVEFCGDHATVIKNYGTSGLVDLGHGQGQCRWYWQFQDTPVTLVRRAKQGEEALMVEIVGKLTEDEYKSLAVMYWMAPEPIEGKPGYYKIKVNADFYKVMLAVDGDARHFFPTNWDNLTGPLSDEQRKYLYQG